MSITFSPEEHRVLRAEGIAIFEDRIILDARPGISNEDVARIAERCAGPLPEDLLALWRASFGGRLEYETRIELAGHEHHVYLPELFYPESSHYNTLDGWIEHELDRAEEQAAERGRESAGKLRFLPFGGNEFFARAYVDVAPGDGYGSVHVWLHSVPPSKDDEGQAATGVRAFFRGLVHEAGSACTDDGQAIRERIASVERRSPTAASRLRQLLAASFLDYRPGLKDGSTARDGRRRRLALEAAANADDVDLLEQIARHGCDLDESVISRLTTLELAVARGSPRVTRTLLDREVNVQNGLAHAYRLSVDLIEELDARGAAPTRSAVLRCAHVGCLDLAMKVVRSLVLRDVTVRANMIVLALKRMREAKDSADSKGYGELVATLRAEAPPRTMLLHPARAVEVGNAVEAVRELLSLAEPPQTYEASRYVYYLGTLGLRIFFNEDRVVDTLIYESPFVYPVFGVGVGDTHDEVRAALGGAKTSPTPPEPSRIDFDFRTGKVEKIFVFTDPCEAPA